MKLTKEEAFLKIANHFRNKRVQELRDSIAQYQSKLKQILDLSGERLVSNYAVLAYDRNKDGVYDCIGGCWGSDAREAAGMLADLTGEAVSFEFNGKVYTEYSREKLT
jgi:hypothetical protein